MVVSSVVVVVVVVVQEEHGMMVTNVVFLGTDFEEETIGHNHGYNNYHITKDNKNHINNIKDLYNNNSY